jgi:hypothetical protein
MPTAFSGYPRGIECEMELPSKAALSGFIDTHPRTAASPENHGDATLDRAGALVQAAAAVNPALLVSQDRSVLLSSTMLK